MPPRTGKCINFGGCNKADAREVISIPDGSEFVCPECEKSLIATAGRKSERGGGSGAGTGKLKFVFAGVAGLALIGGFLAWLFHSSAPEIQDFSVQPALINFGQTATLKWSVNHASDVSIDPGMGPVQTEDSLPVSPRGTTVYTLTAKSGSHLITKSVTLQVNGQAGPVVPPPGPVVPPPNPGPVVPPVRPPAPQPRPVSAPPTIQSLTFTPATVQVGQPSVLQWSTRNTKSVSLLSGNNRKTGLPTSGTIKITPHAPGVINVVAVGVGDRTSVQQTAQLRVGGTGSPSPGPGPIVNPPPVPRPNPNPPENNEDQEPPRSTPASGTLVWEGDVQGTQLVTIQNGVASPGQLISGRLPGVPVILQQQNEKKVGIASAPSPDNQYQRVVLRVFGHGHTRVVVNWSTP